MTDVKKVWNKFKRMAKNEFEMLDSCEYVMNVKQIAKRTATIRVCSSWSYDEHIKCCERDIERVSQWEQDEFRDSLIEREKSRIEDWKFKKQEYGTPLQYTRTVFYTLLGSRAWDFLKNELENIRYGIEEANGCYYIRVNY